MSRHHALHLDTPSLPACARAFRPRRSHTDPSGPHAGVHLPSLEQADRCETCGSTTMVPGRTCIGAQLPFRIDTARCQRCIDRHQTRFTSILPHLPGRWNEQELVISLAAALPLPKVEYVVHIAGQMLGPSSTATSDYYIRLLVSGARLTLQGGFPSL